MAAGGAFAVEVGDKVKTTLTDSGEIEGKIVAISSEAITLDPIKSSRYLKDSEELTSDYLPREISADSIQVLEKRVGSSGKTWLLVGGIFVGAIAIIGIGIGASGGVTTGM